jgi:hypothetical protein
MAVAPSWYSTQYLPSCRICWESFRKIHDAIKHHICFRKTGIFPYDRDVFNDDDFLSSAAKDRPEDQNEMLEIDNSLPCASGEGNMNESATVVVKIEMENKQTDQIPTQVISPKMFRGYPKAESRTPGNKRKRGRSCIPTDTPVKESLVQRAQQGNAKKTEVVKKALKNCLERNWTRQRTRLILQS